VEGFCSSVGRIIGFRQVQLGAKPFDAGRIVRLIPSVWDNQHWAICIHALLWGWNLAGAARSDGCNHNPIWRDKFGQSKSRLGTRLILDIFSPGLRSELFGQSEYQPRVIHGDCGRATRPHPLDLLYEDRFKLSKCFGGSSAGEFAKIVNHVVVISKS
jgi:hypothetical protein